MDSSARDLGRHLLRLLPQTTKSITLLECPSRLRFDVSVSAKLMEWERECECECMRERKRRAQCNANANVNVNVSMPVSILQYCKIASLASANQNQSGFSFTDDNPAVDHFGL